MTEVTASEKSGSFLKSLMDDLHERVNGLKLFSKDAEINAYCEDLHSHVVLTIESAIKQLNVFQDEMLAKITLYRDELISHAHTQTSEPLRQDLESLSTEIRALEERLSVHYNEANLDSELVKMALEASTELKKKTKEMRKEMRRQAFHGKFMTFTANKLQWLDPDIIGRLDISKQDLEDSNEISSIVIGEEPCYKWNDGLFDQFDDGFFLLDGNFARVNFNQRGVKVCNAKTGEVTYELKTQHSRVESMVQHSNGHLLTGHDNGRICIWNLDAKKRIKAWIGHQRSVISMVILPSGIVASLSHDNTIKVWNPYSNTVEQALKTMRGHEMCRDFVRMQSLSNGFLVTCTGDEKCIMRVWNPFTGKLLKEIEHGIGDISRHFNVLPNDDVVIYTMSGLIKVVNLVDEQASRTFFVPEGDQVALTQLPNGRICFIKRRGLELTPWRLDRDKKPPRLRRSPSIFTFWQIHRTTEEKLLFIEYTVSPNQYPLRFWKLDI